MRGLTITALLMSFALSSLACSCGKSWTSNFLSQTENFEYIVLGTYRTSGTPGRPTLDVEKVYKGNITAPSIQLIQGGIDCNHSLGFEDGQRIVIGLHQFGGEGGYVANACVTSVLFVEKNKVVVLDPFHVTPAMSSPRIGMFSRKMKLKKLERRIWMD